MMQKDFSIHTPWQSNSYCLKRALSPDASEWVTCPKSMTKRMKAHCSSVEIEVFQHRQNIPTPFELACLKQDRKQFALIREIVMICDGEPWLFARTIIPNDTLQGKAKCLQTLGTTPIGSILFSDPKTRRTPFEFAHLFPGDFEYQRTLQVKNFHEKSAWARRSCFYLHEKPLLLTEVFLPALFKGIQNGSKC